MKTMILTISILLLQTSLLLANIDLSDIRSNLVNEIGSTESPSLVPVVPAQAIFEGEAELSTFNPDQFCRPSVPETASYNDCPGQNQSEGSCFRPVIPAEAGYGEIF